LRYTERLVDYVLDTKYDKVPAEVINQTKICIMDSIGCTLGGFQTTLGKNVVKVFKELGGKGNSTIIGDGGKTNCVQAAYTNSYLCNLLDYDDTYNGMGHPNDTIVPPALSVGEEAHVSGREYLTAVVLGYEVSIRIGLAIWPSLERTKKIALPIPPWQTFGSVVAAGKLLGLSRTELVDAFGIAGNYAPLSVKITGRPLNIKDGKVAQASANGVLAALLARAGIVGDRRVLDKEAYYWIAAGSDRCDYDKMVEMLGEKYHIMEIAFKPYPSCRFTHPTLDAVRVAVSKNKIDVKDIESIRIKTISHLAPPSFFSDPNPTTIVDAQFCAPYAIAMVLLGIPRGPDWYSEHQINSKDVAQLASKVKIEGDEKEDRRRSEEGKWGATASVHTKDGRTATEYVKYAKGEPENPLNVGELRQKFKELARPIVGSKVDSVIDTIVGLEKIQDMSRLSEMLRA